jgi:hypothetical protein
MALRLGWTFPALGVFGLLGLSSCAELDSSGGGVSLQNLAAQMCNLSFGCNCDNPPPYANQQECTDVQMETYDQIRDEAKAAGLEYDAVCAEKQFDWLAEIGCGYPTEEQLDTWGCAFGCQLYHGDDGPGEACIVVTSRASTCAQGLECENGFCEDRCGNWRLAEGATCYNPSEPVTGLCVTGTFCDANGTNRCTATPAAGDPCSQGACVEDHWCNPGADLEPTCEEVGGIGALCEYPQACSTGYCIDERCAPLPELGEPCSGECGSDLFCQSGVCTVKQGKGQSCDYDLPCASHLWCAGDVCEDAPSLACGG